MSNDNVHDGAIGEFYESLHRSTLEENLMVKREEIRQKGALYYIRKLLNDALGLGSLV